MPAKVDSTHMVTDGNISKLLLSPTARSLPADQGYINLAEIIMPNFGYGITDEIMVRGGFTPFTVSGHVLYFGSAQLQVANYGDMDISGGAILTNFTGSGRGWESALYGYAIVSYGDEIAALHGGFGGGYSSKKESSSAVFMLGAEWRISKSAKLVSENWIISETGASVFSLGIRVIGTTLIGELGGAILTSGTPIKIESIVPWIGITLEL
ncbi:MAG: hypothetical protein ABI778_00210 [Ignavibacteriota bacterium]